MIESVVRNPYGPGVMLLASDAPTRGGIGGLEGGDGVTRREYDQGQGRTYTVQINQLPVPLACARARM